MLLNALNNFSKITQFQRDITWSLVILNQP